MGVDTPTGTHGEEHNEEVQAIGKGCVYCYRSGGQGHSAAKCGTPEPQKGGKRERRTKRSKKGQQGQRQEHGEWIGF